jgi:hypothetical protein
MPSRSSEEGSGEAVGVNIPWIWLCELNATPGQQAEAEQAGGEEEQRRGFGDGRHSSNIQSAREWEDIVSAAREIEDPSTTRRQ